MREGLRILGLGVLSAGALTLLGLAFVQGLGALGPALGGWEQAADLRRGLWIVAGLIYILAGLFLVMLRRWSAVLFVGGAILAAVCMAYDMAAFAHVGLSDAGFMRIQLDIFSLLCALCLTALTVPMARRRVLR